MKKDQTVNDKFKGISDTILTAYNELLNHYFPDCYAAGITGSYAVGMGQEYSDIDAIIISEYSSEVISETFSISGFSFDVFIYPKSNFENYIIKDTLKGECILIDRLKKMVVLKDTEQYLKNIKEKAVVLYAKGPISFLPKEMAMCRYSVLSCLNSLRGDFSREQNIFIVARYVEFILSLHAISKNIWFKVGKHTPSHLKKEDPNFYREFLLSLEEFYTLNDKRRLIELLEKLINSSGSNIIKKSDSHCLNEFNGSHMIIGFCGVKSLQSFIFDVLPLIDKNYQEFNNSFYFYNNQNLRYKDVDYFLILNYSPTNTVEFAKEKLAKLKPLIENGVNKIKIIYPFNLLSDTDSNCIDNLFSVSKYFNYLSSEFINLVLQRGNYEYSMSLKLAFEYTVALIIKNDLNKRDVIRYNQMILEEAISELYLSRNNNYLQLKYLISDEWMQFNERYKILSNNPQIQKLRERLESFKENRIMNKWVLEFEQVFDKSQIGDTASFKMFVSLKSRKDFNDTQIFNYFAYRKMIKIFCGIVGLVQKDKCFCLFTINKLIKESIEE